MKKLGFLLTLLAVLTLACAPAEKPAEPEPAPAPEPMATEAEMTAEEAPTAVAILHNAEGDEVGFARFVQAEGAVIVTAEVGGLDDGAHGFHVHENGTCAPDFKAAGGHYNPLGKPHACPPDPERHAGDFGNIESVEGNARLETTSELITVTPGETSILDRAVIVHNGKDDCVSQPTGDAGSRYACGVIRLEAAEGEGAGMGMGEDEEEDEKEDAG